MDKIAFGGGCHWCTEAVFQSLKGVEKVEQGFVSSVGENANFSEAVIVHFDPERLSLTTLIEIHLYTHRSASNHSMRSKYRSAVYSFSDAQALESRKILKIVQPKFDRPLITEVLDFEAFAPSEVQFTDYYYKNPQKPFCRTYIQPKLDLLLRKYSDTVNGNKIRIK